MEEMCFEFFALGNMLKRHIENSSGLKYVEKYTGSNHWILCYLFNNMGQDVFQKDLEEAFSLRRSTVSKAIKQMEQKELINRESVDYDARLKKLVLTPKALELNEIVRNDLEQIGNKMTKGLSDEQIEQFSGILKMIKENFEYKEKM